MVRAVPDTVWWDSYRNAFQISAQGLFKAVSSSAHCHCFIWLAPASHFLSKYRWFGLQSDPLTAASFVFLHLISAATTNLNLLLYKEAQLNPTTTCLFSLLSALPCLFHSSEQHEVQLSGVHVIWKKCHSLKLQSFIWKPLQSVLVSLIDLTGSECFKCNWP